MGGVGMSKTLEQLRKALRLAIWDAAKELGPVEGSAVIMEVVGEFVVGSAQFAEEEATCPRARVAS